MTIQELNKALIGAKLAKEKAKVEVLKAIKITAVNIGIQEGLKEDGLTEEILKKAILKEQTIVTEQVTIAEKVVATETDPERLQQRKAMLEEFKEKLAIVTEFAPTIITDKEEIKEIINSLGVEIIQKNMGKIMKLLGDTNVDRKIASGVLKTMF